MKNVDEYSPLVLAYIGDVVYELAVRKMLVSRANMPVDKLHKAAVNYVKAAGQYERFHRIQDRLTEKEISIFKRGRNAKSTVPKNGDMMQYHVATGLEALIGYISLSGDEKRLNEILLMLLED